MTGWVRVYDCGGESGAAVGRVCVCGGVLELEEWSVGRETERERVRKDNFFTG